MGRRDQLLRVRALPVLEARRERIGSLPGAAAQRMVPLPSMIVPVHSAFAVRIAMCMHLLKERRTIPQATGCGYGLWSARLAHGRVSHGRGLSCFDGLLHVELLQLDGDRLAESHIAEQLAAARGAVEGDARDAAGIHGVDTPEQPGDGSIDRRRAE